MQDQLEALQREIATAQAASAEELQAFWKRFVSKKGVLATHFAQLKSLPLQERKAWGASINSLKQAAQQRYAALQAQLQAGQTVPVSPSPSTDMTLPVEAGLGSLHPLTHMQQRLSNILSPLGFQQVDGPHIEDEWHNFTALGFPQDHPARQMHDTFFIAGDPQRLLRTHTSCVQVRTLRAHKPPLRIFCSGAVFRKETISARSHCMFHQLEGLYVDEQVSFADLKALLLQLVHGLFGQQAKMRLRPSYFPFTEPSAELDVSCLLCQGEGCSVCKQTGWVEIAGAGMVDPAVLTHCEVDPERYSGYAFGLGLERLAMLYYRIPDVRLFMQNDVRLLRQFTTASS